MIRHPDRARWWRWDGGKNSMMSRVVGYEAATAAAPTRRTASGATARRELRRPTWTTRGTSGSTTMESGTDKTARDSQRPKEALNNPTGRRGTASAGSSSRSNAETTENLEERRIQTGVVPVRRRADGKLAVRADTLPSWSLALRRGNSPVIRWQDPRRRGTDRTRPVADAAPGA